VEGCRLVVVIPPFALVLPHFYRILCEGGIKIVRIGRSHDCKVSGVRENGSGCSYLTFVQVSTSSILRGKRFRPIQDDHVREAPPEKVIRRGQTEAPSSNDNNWAIWLYCRHLGDSRKARKKEVRYSPRTSDVHEADKIGTALRLFVFHRKAKQTQLLNIIVQTPKNAMVAESNTIMQQFRKVVKSSKNIVVIAGAGLSAASGEHPPKRPRPLFISLTNRHL